MKKAVILHQALGENPLPDETDVLEQARSIANSLLQLGYQSKLIPVTLDLSALKNELLSSGPVFVFNLVETIDHHGRLIHLVPALLDALEIPYTGNGEYALKSTTGKIEAKLEMIKNGIPTPLFFKREQAAKLPAGKKFILKPVWEDASVGINDHNIVNFKNASMELRRVQQSGIQDWFFEAYIEGREFNLSLLESGSGWDVLPPAEIRFENYPPGKPKILGYESKWDEESFEYKHTMRSFNLKPADNLLIRDLKDLALQCIEVFQLKGYARVDFRVDEMNNPAVLEINANPCLSPDAGFFAACQQAGKNYTDVVRQIINTALNEKV